MQDGSDAIADWPILNALLNAASGASWVSFHHGGGVGIGFSQHAGHGHRRRRHASWPTRARARADQRPRHGRHAPRRRRLRARHRGRRASAACASPCSRTDVAHVIPWSGEVVLNGAELTVADVESVAREGRAVVLDDDARERIAEARAVIERLVAEGDVVYGVTTGFGDLASTFIPPEEHAAAPGEPPDEPRRRRRSRRSRARSCARCSCCAPTRWPSATRAAGRRSSTACWRSSSSGSTRSCRRRGASVRRATSRRSPTSPCRSSGAARWRSSGRVMPAAVALRGGRAGAARRSRRRRGWRSSTGPR